MYSYFQETAGKQTVLKVGTESRTVPARARLPSFRCRTRTLCAIARGWKTICAKLIELSGGKLAYVYLPNTGAGGFRNFNRYFFAQIDKQGAVIDERFNYRGPSC